VDIWRPPIVDVTKVGVPVRVHYVGEGQNMLIDRVILEED